MRHGNWNRVSRVPPPSISTSPSIFTRTYPRRDRLDGVPPSPTGTEALDVLRALWPNDATSGRAVEAYGLSVVEGDENRDRLVALVVLHWVPNAKGCPRARVPCVDHLLWRFAVPLPKAESGKAFPWDPRNHGFGWRG